MDLEAKLQRPVFSPKLVDPEDRRKLAQHRPTYSPSMEYALGYKSAADELVDRYGSGYPYYWTSHIYPICFLYRHAIEVALKEAIGLTLKVLDRQPTKQINDMLGKHSLERLFTLFHKLLDQVDGDEGRGERDKVMALMKDRIAELHEIDPNSITFRYPTDRHGNQKSLDEGWTVDLANLKKSVDAVWDLLLAVYTGLDERLQLKWELESQARDG